MHYELFIDGQRVDPTYGSELIDPMSFIIGLLTTEIECIIVEVQGTGNKPSKYIINSINFDRLGKIVLHDVSTENTSLDKAVEIEKQ